MYFSIHNKTIYDDSNKWRKDEENLQIFSRGVEIAGTPESVMEAFVWVGINLIVRRKFLLAG